MHTPKVWTNDTTRPGWCTLIVLTGDALHLGDVPAAGSDAAAAKLVAGQAPAEVLGPKAQTFPYTAVRGVELTPANKELRLDYVKEPDHTAAQLAVPFPGAGEAEEALTTLRDHLGPSWDREERRQSAWRALERPGKFLLGAVGIPLAVILTTVLGGELDLNDALKKENRAGCLYAAVVIAVITLSAIYLGTAWTVGIGAALAGVWLLWAALCVVTRPAVVRLVPVAPPPFEVKQA